MPNTLTPLSFLLLLQPPPPHSSISLTLWLGEGFLVCEAREEGLAANSSHGCKECEIPSWRGGRERGERNGGGRQGCQRQGMGEEPSYGASRAGVQVPPPLRRLSPRWFPAYPSGPSITVHLNTTLCTQIPAPPPRSSSRPRPPLVLLKAPTLQWASPTRHPPALLYHLWTPPFLHFSSLLPSLRLTSKISNPGPNPPGTSPPPLPRPPLGGSLRRRRTHRPGSGLDSPCPDPLELRPQQPRDNPGAGCQPILGGEGEGEGEGEGIRFRPLVAL